MNLEIIKKVGILKDLVLIRGGGESGSPIFFVNIFVLKTFKDAMKHMMLSFKMKGDVISDHFLML